ncbi:helix-turn-helix domain-containing protein [Saccharibacillus alkalitolerans]|uniref:AraC family transcriptional regulator n=1 Tax=Saccharibacillus alkalitolerans TaxID=2705290 RepID=A0ABX0F1Y6_9BACL|nr:AraC family transcriptional regulator [Saccharibacillus alkalitolerans]NGZ74455.1 AraC family transcriptional regulator [Saccharibacillus alkalitolerans]
MTLRHIPDTLHYGAPKDPLRTEFDRRSGHFSMAENHYHRDYELYYLFSGERRYFIKDSVYRVQAGDLVLIDSNELHKSGDSGVPDHERIVLYFSPEYFAELPSEERDLLLAPFTQGSPLIRPNLQERLRAEELLTSLLAELHERPPGYRLRMRHMAGELLLLTARCFLRRGPVSLPEPTPVQRKVSDAVRYINAHYAEPLELDELSKRFYISRSHLSRTFKDVTGFGFAEYVNITRVREAQRLLRETDLSVTSVSELAGFDNFSHFGKMFKRLSGMSPRTYRKLGGTLSESAFDRPAAPSE